MKIFKKGGILITLVLIFQIFFMPISSKVFALSKIASFKDAREDDYGPGSFEYPTTNQITDGEFDIKKITIAEDKTHYIFIISFVQDITKWSDLNFKEDSLTYTTKDYYSDDIDNEYRNQFPYFYWDFVNQAIDIYVLSDKSDIKYETLPGRLFKVEGGWTKAVVVTPADPKWIEDLLENKSDNEFLLQYRHDLVIPDSIMIINNKIEIFVRKKNLGNIKRIAVAVMQYNPFQTNPSLFLINEVKSSPSEKFFGGRLSSNCPNAIDILNSKSQKLCYKTRILESFDIKNPNTKNSTVKKTTQIQSKILHNTIKSQKTHYTMASQPKFGDVKIEKESSKNTQTNKNKNLPSANIVTKPSDAPLKSQTQQTSTPSSSHQNVTSSTLGNKSENKTTKNKAQSEVPSSLKARALSILTACEMFTVIYGPDKKITLKKLIDLGFLSADQFTEDMKIDYDPSSDTLTLYYKDKKITVSGGSR